MVKVVNKRQHVDRDTTLQDAEVSKLHTQNVVHEFDLGKKGLAKRIADK